jgi:cyclopropane fatty-acyl-phospholipid synthase-like methyltransferase
MKLISDYYIEQLNEIHNRRKSFGSFGGRTNIKFLEPWIKKYGAKTFIDYGCGKGVLVNTLKEQYGNCTGYDPGYAEFIERPTEPSDMLISTDVLEHIEPEHIDDVLTHMGMLFTKCAYLLICCSPAAKKLADGRNAHLIVEEDTWWRPKILKNMDVKIVHQEFSFRHWYDKHKNPHPKNEYILVLEKR